MRSLSYIYHKRVCLHTLLWNASNSTLFTTIEAGDGNLCYNYTPNRFGDKPSRAVTSSPSSYQRATCQPFIGSCSFILCFEGWHDAMYLWLERPNSCVPFEDPGCPLLYCDDRITGFALIFYPASVVLLLPLWCLIIYAVITVSLVILVNGVGCENFSVSTHPAPVLHHLVFLVDYSGVFGID